MIAIEHLSLRFHRGTPDERVALDDLSFDIAESEFLVVIGTNGAGKTTLLNAVAGSIVPERGRIMVDGVDIVPMPVHRRARFVARVFQDPMVGTAPALTIEENLAFASRRGVGRKFKLALNPHRRAARFATCSRHSGSGWKIACRQWPARSRADSGRCWRW